MEILRIYMHYFKTMMKEDLNSNYLMFGTVA